MYENVNSFREALLVARKSGHRYGPYSFSRLDGDCDFQFKKQYIDKEEGTQLTRFGTDTGSIMHELAEFDVQMRLTKDPDDWDSIEDIASDAPAELVEQLENFRFSFEIHPELYAGSEVHLGCDIDMNGVDYDDPKAWFRGKIDYLEIDNQSGMVRVVDYKNYPRVHSDAEINFTSSGVGCQQMGYLAMAMATYPHIKAGWYEIYYFRFGTSRTSSVKSDVGRVERRLIGRDEVERWWRLNQQRMISMERKTEFLPKPSQFSCQYCRFMHLCPWYEQYGENEIIIKDEKDAQDLLSRLTVLKEEEKRLKSVLDHHASENGPIELGNGTSYGYRQTVQTKIDTRLFLKVCQNYNIDPAPFISVSKTNADKLLDITEGDGLLKEAYMDSIKTRKVFK